MEVAVLLMVVAVLAAVLMVKHIEAERSRAVRVPLRVNRLRVRRRR